MICGMFCVLDFFAVSYCTPIKDKNIFTLKKRDINFSYKLTYVNNFFRGLYEYLKI